MDLEGFRARYSDHSMGLLVFRFQEPLDSDMQASLKQALAECGVISSQDDAVAVLPHEDAEVLTLPWNPPNEATAEEQKELLDSLAGPYGIDCIRCLICDRLDDHEQRSADQLNATSEPLWMSEYTVDDSSSTLPFESAVLGHSDIPLELEGLAATFSPQHRGPFTLTLTLATTEILGERQVIDQLVTFWHSTFVAETAVDKNNQHLERSWNESRRQLQIHVQWWPVEFTFDEILARLIQTLGRAQRAISLQAVNVAPVD